MKQRANGGRGAEEKIKSGEHAAEQGNAEPPPPACLVGVGSGGGGVESIVALLRSLPSDAGLSLLIAVHAPEGTLAGLVATLARATRMPVSPAMDGAAIEPNHVYVAPPEALVRREKGHFDVSPRPAGSLYAPIDVLFRSLASARRDLVMGVVLSGHTPDGALGTVAIKTGGGITFAEDIRAAKHQTMPQHAVGTGYVDFMLPPADIAARIAELAARVRAVELSRAGAPDELGLVLARRGVSDVDFRLYRRPAVRRSVSRRMAMARVATLTAYADLLGSRPAEIDALLRGMLVRTTRFFRDPKVFDAIKSAVCAELVVARPRDATLRIWVPGCATGEEAYSIAIALLEAAAELRSEVLFQIFGTDVCDESLERARAGTYPENIALDVSPERLSRFFTKTGSHYQVLRSIRESCVFARHDVTRDPPLGRLDLVSCRNVLSYLEPHFAVNVIPAFHYALRPAGFLVLGASELLGVHAELFSQIDEAANIHAKPAANDHRSNRPARAAESEPPKSVAEKHLDLLLQELQATNEELQATNEELLSSNEELQNINDELAATKEDLETANAALARRNEELAGVNDDLANLIASVSLPMIIVDRERRIRRFTPQAGRSLNLVNADVGRPLGDVDLSLDTRELDDIIADVMDTLSMREHEVQDRRGRWHAMRVRPYVTANHRIDGAVLLFFDVECVRRDSAPRARAEG